MTLTEALTRDVTATFNQVNWLSGFVDAKDASRNTVLNYDLMGNLVEKVTQGGTRTFAWDIRNTLTAVHDNGQEVGRYDYDNNLQRTQRKAASEDVAYVLDDGFVLQELDGAQATHPSKRRYHYGGGPLAVSEVATSATSFLGTDALGSVTDALSTSGNVTAARQYDAWGNPRGGTAPTVSDFKLGYTGHQYDVETGLTYARARYYDSELGRFISRDSYEGQLGDAPSLHRYAYAFGNPLKFTDVSGHDPWSGDFIWESRMLADGQMSQEHYDTIQKARGLGVVAGATMVVGGGAVAGWYEVALVHLGLAGGAVVVAEGTADTAGMVTGMYGCGVWQDASACRDMVVSGLDLLSGPFSPLAEESLARRARSGFVDGRRLGGGATEVIEAPSGGTANLGRAHTGESTASKPSSRGIGERTSAGVVLDDAEIGRLKQEVLELEADPSMFHFNAGRNTGYVQPKEGESGPGRIHVRGDVLPAEGAVHPRSSMSTRAVLAHEYWGHAQYPKTKLEPRVWNDEFRASYTAAAEAPNLTFRERQDLMRDAVMRAEEANRSIKPNALMRYFFSDGYSDPPAWWTPPKGFKPPGEE